MNKHTIKFGGEWRKNRDILLQTQDAGGPRGRFAFTASGTGSPAEQASLSGLANSFASFLLDWPNTVQRDLKVIDQPGTRHWAIASFIQDKWQVRQNITVDLGLRWEFYKPLEGVKGQGSLSNYDPSTNTLHVSGYGRHVRSPQREELLQELRTADGHLLASQRKDGRPRRLRRQRDSLPGQPLRVRLPGEAELLGIGGQRIPASGIDGDRASRHRPSRTFRRTAFSRSADRCSNSTYDVIPPGLHEGTLYSWNVAFQRQLPYGLTADIAYVGSKGVDLVADLDTNASLVYGSGNAGRPQFAQFNRTGTSRTRTNLGKSRYNGLQVKVDRRFMNGLLITNSYTFGQSKDLAQENTGINTPIDFDLVWARSDTDRLHNYVLSSVYELPWGPNKRWMNDSTLGKIVGGWQVSGLFVAQSGQALTIGGNGTLLNTPGNTAFVNLTGDNKVLGGLGPGQLYFDPTVYSLPAAGVQGNQKRHSGPDGPGFWQLDGSLFKRFAVGASRYGEFRVDAYNLTNSVRWANPNVTFSTATGNTFGQITGTNGSLSARIRFGGRFAF